MTKLQLRGKTKLKCVHKHNMKITAVCTLALPNVSQYTVLAFKKSVISWNHDILTLAERFPTITFGNFFANCYIIISIIQIDLFLMLIQYTCLLWLHAKSADKRQIKLLIWVAMTDWKLLYTYFLYLPLLSLVWMSGNTRFIRKEVSFMWCVSIITIFTWQDLIFNSFHKCNTVIQ